MNISNLRTMSTLMAKDCMALRVPILASVIVGVACYLVPFIGQLPIGTSGADSQPAVVYPVPARIERVLPVASQPARMDRIFRDAPRDDPATIQPTHGVPVRSTAGNSTRHWRLSAAAMVDAAQVGIVVTAILAAVFGGIAIAGERAERTAEFLAMLPVTRGQIMSSKAIVAVFVIAACAIVHWGITLILWRSGAWRQSVEDVAAAAWLWMAAVCSLFGVAWLLSTCMRSTPISACSSMALTIGVFAITDILQGSRSGHAHVRDFWDTPFALVSPLLLLGVGSVLAGTAHYLKRIEP